MPFSTVNTQEQISDKLRGGYYTPREITDFLAKWVVRNIGAKVLEPSCGDGQFIKSLVNEFGNSISITGIELIAKEATKALLQGNKKTGVIVSDAFAWYILNRPDARFDAVVGNPPFIRYQNFPEEHRRNAFTLLKEEGLPLSRLTNSWLPFVVLATKALKKGGRLALVLPAELLQVSYAKELRKYLSLKYQKISIVTFKELVFPNIQQEIVLVLAERGECPAARISFIECTGLADLHHEWLTRKEKQHRIQNINHDNEKWTQFFLSPEELDLVRRIESSSAFARLGDIARINVGVVTGNNDFFVLNSEQANNLDVRDHCEPIIGRSNQLSGILFTQSDYRAISKQGGGTLLFNPRELPRAQFNNSLTDYIKSGENSGVTEGYKCKIRLPHWWQVPSVWKPDAFLLRQIHEFPKMIANQTRATSTDTVHRVKITTSIPAPLLAAALFNSLTFALAEIRGRSYGGGILELEPTEAESLLIPRLSADINMPLSEVDRLVRSKKITEALDLVDSIVLKTTGLDDAEIHILRGIWQKLKARRISRNKTTSRKVLYSSSSSLSFPSMA